MPQRQVVGRGREEDLDGWGGGEGIEVGGKFGRWVGVVWRLGGMGKGVIGIVVVVVVAVVDMVGAGGGGFGVGGRWVGVGVVEEGCYCPRGFAFR